MKKLITVLVTILSVLTLTGFACYGQANVVYGCYKKDNGQLRIVNNTSECRPSEGPISWNRIGQQGVGNLGVYDGNGLFLGYFIQYISTGADYPLFYTLNGYLVFNPDMQAFLRVILEQPPYLHAKQLLWACFKSVDCSGEPYIFLAGVIEPVFGPHELFKLKDVTPVEYYVYDTEVPVVTVNDLRSQRSFPSGNCRTYNPTPPTEPPYYAAFPLKKIDVPLFNATITYPIVVKPIQ